MNFGNGKLIDNITHLVPGRSDLLGSLERGEFDATLLDARRLDAYRAQHRDSQLAVSGYYYPFGANRGYVGLGNDPGLLAAVNKALSDLQAKGAIAELARAAGLTYLPPREPVVLGDVMQRILQQ
jgi:ABC-type amino acid transport substrate-binding protein